VAGLFPPQERDFLLPTEAPLTAKAAERLARESAIQTFAPAARALSIDWQVTLDGKQVQRWGEALGCTLCNQQQERIEALKQGHYPAGPANAPELLVIGLDGGRYQSREKDSQSQSRWKEDKVASFTSYLPGEGPAKPPVALVGSVVASTCDSGAFGPMVKLEALARGANRAKVVINISDGAGWIDSIEREQHLADVRIVDFYHAAEHVHGACETALGQGSVEVRACFAEKRGWLWEGKMAELLDWMRQERARIKEESAERGESLGREIGYFETRQKQMDYPAYRSRGWPIGSGGTESAVKQFNKRIKGTEQFWNPHQLEAILALRALWLADDDRWHRYWTTRSAYRRAA
jgi:hypothetical protein